MHPHTHLYWFFSSPAEQSDKNSALIKQEMLALQAMLNTLDYKRKVSDTFCHLWFVCFLPLFPHCILKRVCVPFSIVLSEEQTNNIGLKNPQKVWVGMGDFD